MSDIYWCIQSIRLATVLATVLAREYETFWSCHVCVCVCVCGDIMGFIFHSRCLVLNNTINWRPCWQTDQHEDMRDTHVNTLSNTHKYKHYHLILGN